MWKLDPLPVLPPNLSADLGEGECAVYMNIFVTTQVEIIPPPLSVFDNGGGQGGGRTPQEQEMVKREIESTDKAIDRLVYALYGLSEDEIRIVES